MPYIKDEDRKKFGEAIDYLKKTMAISTAGELNYLISMLCKIYAMGKENFNYQSINDIVGALECAKQEFIRRNVNGYEDVKIRENGDI